MSKKKDNPDQCGEFELLKSCSKERTVKFEVQKWESIKKLYLEKAVKPVINYITILVEKKEESITPGRSRRETATLGKIKQRFNSWDIQWHISLGGITHAPLLNKNLIFFDWLFYITCHINTPFIEFSPVENICLRNALSVLLS